MSFINFSHFKKEKEKLSFDLMMEIGIEAEWVAIFLFDITEWVTGIMLMKRRSPCEFAMYIALSSWW